MVSPKRGFVQVQAAVRSHVSRWKDGRHFQGGATRVLVFVSADQPGADGSFPGEVEVETAEQPLAAERCGPVVRRERKDDEQPVSQMLLPLRTATANVH